MGRTHNLDTTFARIADPIGFVEGKDVLELVQSILALRSFSIYCAFSLFSIFYATVSRDFLQDCFSF